jgi:hypothetical protein
MMLRILWGVVTLVSCALPPIKARATLVPSVDGITANTNLPAGNRFELSVCNASAIAPCVNASGSMNYKATAASVQAMNAANYLGPTNRSDREENHETQPGNRNEDGNGCFR